MTVRCRRSDRAADDGAVTDLCARSENLSGKRAVVVGRSLVIGRPVSMLLMRKDATVTICHSKTKDLASHTKNADVLIAAVGRPGSITADMVKPGAFVLDVGMNVGEDGRLCGDCEYEEIEKIASVTPVPGGVGAVTTTVLMLHTVRAAEMATVFNL